MSDEMFADLMESAIEMVEMENAMSTEKFKVTDNRIGSGTSNGPFITKELEESIEKF